MTYISCESNTRYTHIRPDTWDQYGGVLCLWRMCGDDIVEIVDITESSYDDYSYE
jgi:hypothetical protein